MSVPISNDVRPVATAAPAPPQARNTLKPIPTKPPEELPPSIAEPIVDKKPKPKHGEDYADHIESWLGLNPWRIGEQPGGQQHAQDYKRFQTEGKTPRELSCDPASDKWAEGSDGSRHTEEHAVGGRTLGPRIIRTDQRVDGGNDQGRTEPLQDRPADDDEDDARL